ncbi:adenylate/guanylate cyclase domain-containing protein [Terasakiella sp. A23]|uniref:adenylate/guanylate cyclase domain-containing protein n=1 Tax=Terasakiella sp. FCG-A23 TaxID=3080561 RepID=UPI00295438E3|nr:adenylate/guanylate cyclase domain-containing protein [Terasakiella sp. A23]MDV7340765.1 adenylate/guanylate cyclase domain-containing protein [Terasakiella sp. A23]
MGTHDNQNYEVQVHHHGRWQVHARYAFHERAVALREAKELDIERKGHPVRVIMEEYNDKTGRHNEILVYRNKLEPTKAKPKGRAKSSTSWADMAVSSDGRVGYTRDDVDDFLYDDPFEEIERPKAKVSARMFLAIISTILVIGVGSGGAAAGLLALLIKGFGVSIEAHIEKALLIGMFVTVFLIASLSSLSYYTTRFDLNPFKKKEKKKPVVKKSKISKEMEKAAEAIDKMPTVEVTQEPEEEFNIFDELEKLEISEPDESIEFSEEAEKQKMFMVNFLGTSLGALKGPDAKAQNLNRFGLNLFMTGATARIAKDHDLTQDEFDIILRRILEMLGAKSAQAERFAAEYEKYLADPRHAELFNDAGEIAARYSNGDQSAPLFIRETIEEWVNWKPKIDETINPNLLTIMFTDMVGSTDLTTKHGDFAAQEVLKAHDLIVRTALTNLEGTEIKHLGDGIMASFKDHDMAMQAAIEIQKRVEGNNKSGPEFPLHVRIGLNAGEPIKKNNDLFGTSVQLAARLCDFTPSDSICVSQFFKDLFGEQPVYTFMDIGPQSLKGFEEDQQIYQIDWTAPPIEYLDEEEGKDTLEEGEEGKIELVATEGVAPDIAAAAPVKEAATDDGFDAGLTVNEEQVSEEAPATPVATDEEPPKNA